MPDPDPTFDGELMWPSEYLKHDDLKGRDVTLRIKRVTHEELQLKNGAKKMSFVLHFHKTDKKVVLNKTNSRTIAKLYAKEAMSWVDEMIVIFPTTCRFGKDPKCPCIRVRPFKPDSRKAREDPDAKAPEAEGDVQGDLDVADAVDDAIKGSVDDGTMSAEEEARMDREMAERDAP